MLNPLNFVIVVLAAVGLCQGLMTTPLLMRLRRASPFADNLLSCPICTGFHAGWIMAFAYCVCPWICVPFIASWVASVALKDL